MRENNEWMKENISTAKAGNLGQDLVVQICLGVIES